MSGVNRIGKWVKGEDKQWYKSIYLDFWFAGTPIDEEPDGTVLLSLHYFKRYSGQKHYNTSYAGIMTILGKASDLDVSWCSTWAEAKKEAETIARNYVCPKEVREFSDNLPTKAQDALAIPKAAQTSDEAGLG